MLYDKKKELIKKYADILDEIGNANPQGEDQHQADLGVAMIMLEAMAKSGQHDLYPGVPEDFDWETFTAEL